MWLLVFILLFILSYILFGFFLQTGWNKIPETIIPDSFVPRTNVCVIIPIRNEINNLNLLLQQLCDQKYPTDLMMIYLADDHSTDGSTECMKEWALLHSDIFRYIEVSEHFKIMKGKKKVIASSIALTDADLIITTDADCSVPRNWIRNFVYVYETSNPVFISGPVKMVGQQSFWGKFQELEFASLVGSGASAIGIGKPMMCNGANLAYSREAYNRVNGFEGNEQIASGDDEFLMHKMASVFPGKISFLKKSDSIVLTKASSMLNDFVQQRKRWAGKWSHYTVLYVRLLALWIFCFHFMLIAGLFLCLLNQIEWYWIALLWATKAVFDYFYLKSVTKFLSIGFKSSIFINSLIIYPWYVVTFGLLSRFGNYDWKERTESLS